MKKRLSKTLWYGTDVDTIGKPIVPPFTDDPSDLNGLHIGELFIHYANGKSTLWTANENGNVVSIVNGDSVDLSGYLLKSIWDSAWELKKDSNGNEYILGKLPLAIAGGVTMYADSDNLDIPSIYAGLPIDDRTIVRDENGVLMINPGIDLGGGLDEVELTEFLTTNGYAKKSDIPSLTGYATQSWVEGKGYALASDLDSISAKLNNFLEGSDTDTIINKWLELETFLSGLSESDNLATILAGKIDKTYVDSNFVTINTAQSISGEKNFTGGLKVNGAPIVYNSEKGYWKLEGDLLVTGGVSFYSSDTEYVPSTIMDALLLDDSTLGINSDGQLYVKGGGTADAVAWENITDKPSWIGSTKPSYNMGELSNVGSWANSVADVDRIMYQAAGSSMWVAKSLSSIGGGGGVSGDYLPLSGGTLTGSSNTPLVLKGAETNTYIAFRGSDDTFFGSIGVRNDNFAYLYAGGYNHQLLHSGNYSNYALPRTGGTLAGTLHFDSTKYSISHIDDSSGGRLDITNNVGGVGFGLYDDGRIQVYQGGFRDVLHSGNYSSYALPLSGGVIKRGTTVAPLAIDTDSSEGVGLCFVMSAANKGWVGYNSNKGTVIYNYVSDTSIGVKNDGSLYYGKGTIWHSGNDGSGSGLDADLLDGVQEYDFCRLYDGIPIETHRGIGYGYTDYGWISNGPALSVGHYGRNYLMQLQAPGNSTALYFRNRMNGTWGDWKTIAFTDSNVASATKLQTARTIWGQSFDGTGNVDGILTMTTHDQINGTKGLSLNYASGGLVNTAIWNGQGGVTMYCTSSGNVGIGTTSPNHKLDVVGNVAFGGTTGCDVWLKRTNGSSYINAAYSLMLTVNNSSNNYALGIAANKQVTIYSNLLVNGGITMYSDQRKKTILNNVELSLKQIANAPLVEHFYNSDDKRTTHVGSIAQYWANINDWFCKLDNEGYYTMEVQNCALASAISIARELSRYESKTDKKIKQLKKRICQLEDELERLKSA